MPAAYDREGGTRNSPIYSRFVKKVILANGLGELFRFHFIGNFQYPYLLRSIQEFWRRWNITLVSAEFLYDLRSYGILLMVAVVGAMPWLKEKITSLRVKENWNRVFNALEPVMLIVLILVVTAYLINDSYNPSLYFRF